MIADVSAKLLTQFVQCLEGKFDAPAGATGDAPPAPAPRIPPPRPTRPAPAPGVNGQFVLRVGGQQNRALVAT